MPLVLTGDGRATGARKPNSGHTGTVSLMVRGAPGPPERHETPDPRRSDAVKAWIQCVRRAGRRGSGGSAGVTAGRQVVRRVGGRARYWRVGRCAIVRG